MLQYLIFHAFSLGSCSTRTAQHRPERNSKFHGAQTTQEDPTVLDDHQCGQFFLSFNEIASVLKIAAIFIFRTHSLFFIWGVNRYHSYYWEFVSQRSTFSEYDRNHCNIFMRTLSAIHSDHFYFLSGCPFSCFSFVGLNSLVGWGVISVPLVITSIIQAYYVR
jgi:hypothetical protein